MIIVTNRAPELIEWLEANLADSTYTFCKSWHADILPTDEMNHIAGDGPPQTIEIAFDATDRMLFDLAWAGAFVQSSRNGHWYDDTQLNRWMLETMG